MQIGRWVDTIQKQDDIDDDRPIITKLTVGTNYDEDSVTDDDDVVLVFVVLSSLSSL